MKSNQDCMMNLPAGSKEPTAKRLRYVQEGAGLIDCVIRCDSFNMPGLICSNCKAFNSECTHSSPNAKKKRSAHASTGSISSSTSATSVENHRIEPAPMSALNDDRFSFARHQISVMLDAPLYQAPMNDYTLLHRMITNIATYARSLEAALSKVIPGHSSLDDPLVTRSEHCIELTEFGFRRTRILMWSRSSSRTYSNNWNLKEAEIVSSVNQAIGKEHPGLQPNIRKATKQTMPRGCCARAHLRGFYQIFLTVAQETSILERWQLPATQSSLPPLEFPPPPLLDSLVDFYFIRRNRLLPLLHRPTSQRVCAIGARYSQDKMVYDERAREGSEERAHSIGWKYINQIGFIQEFSPENVLYRVRTICNCVVFLSTASTQGSIWALLAIGVRHAQAVGAHGRTFLGTKLSVRQELWKRAFWTLIFLDSITIAHLGRPKATDRAEYDLAMPIECDDEYWEHPDPNKAFKQPPGTPSTVTFWTTLLKLVDILVFAHRSIW
ncbi:hypothetical protein D9757_007023 [Collybiopsis confluens]|uniref:Xylanolytic transcriptional activator regulatory domain-containing protein n=1 Tax=Collybiopsis confluens TaxID=2823264 RepID=A0A8H5HC75_9AGAR|nr:hypothetical protein D9757_007023 [Collybiopsis confluens]